MKVLKFSSPLSDMIMRGEKTTTWRVNDNKDLKVGDKFKLITRGTEEFAQGEITYMKTTTFGEIIDEDFDGHEKFSSHEELLATYSNYYNMEVIDSTQLKIIKFKLI